MKAVDFAHIRAALAGTALVGFDASAVADIAKAGSTKRGLVKGNSAKRGLIKINAAKRGIMKVR